MNRDSLFSSADAGNIRIGDHLITLADKEGEPGVLLVSVTILQAGDYKLEVRLNELPVTLHAQDNDLVPF